MLTSIKRNPTWEIAEKAVAPDATTNKIPVEKFNLADKSGRTKLLKKAFSDAVLEVGGVRVLHNMTCFNADHDDRTPSMVFDKDGGHYHCYGCMETGHNFDVFDAIGAVYGLIDFKDQYAKALDLFVDEPSRVRPINLPYKDAFPKPMYRTMMIPYYTPIEHDPDALAYLESRGIRKATAVKHGLRVWEYQGWLYIVFVNDNGSVVRRRFASTADALMYAEQPDKWWNSKGTGGYFNLRAVEKATYDNPIIYVTEGVFDALSLVECGYNAIALNSVNRLGGLLQETNYPYLVGLFDNDMGGTVSGFIFKDNGFYVPEYTPETTPHLCQYKDVNEALVDSKTRTKTDLAAIDRNARAFYGLE